MPQTPCVKVQAGEIIPDPTTTTRLPGDVYVLGTMPLIVCATDPNLPGKNSLDTEQIWDVPKDTSTFTAGDPVYWDDNGTPVTGTALSGCATSTAAGNSLMGFATIDAATGASYVRTKLTAARRIPTRIATATVAATGSAQGDAAAIVEGFTLVTAGDGTKGVALPSAVAGMQVIVKNGAGAILKVYPATSDAINALSANAALSMAANTSALFVAYDATTWYTVPLLPS